MFVSGIGDRDTELTQKKTILCVVLTYTIQYPRVFYDKRESFYFKIFVFYIFIFEADDGRGFSFLKSIIYFKVYIKYFLNTHSVWNATIENKLV